MNGRKLKKNVNRLSHGSIFYSVNFLLTNIFLGIAIKPLCFFWLKTREYFLKTRLFRRGGVTLSSSCISTTSQDCLHETLTWKLINCFVLPNLILFSGESTFDPITYICL